MNELVKLGEKTFCLLNAVNVGFYIINENDVCLIDSGSGKDYVKNINKVLESNNWNLKYIINTHSHADHIYGNQKLQDKYGCKIYCSEIEKSFINYPILEPTLFYGAMPIEDLKNRFLNAPKSVCEDIAKINLDGIEIIDLKGHSPNMIGILTSDNVLFCGDAFTSKSIIEKYQIQYIFDIQEYKNTLEKISNMKYSYIVPSHGVIEKDATNTIDVNLKICNAIEMQVLDFLEKENTFESLLEKVFEYYHINMNVTQYFLISSTIKAYLKVLNDKGLISFEVVNNKLIIKKTNNF